ncbi:periplasmic binding protein-like II [Anaeromyces robustus]|uniref:Periplasmic binding protein-like II n=1 Tax=Anaeromyces robustus TaxID=1754192 RepID=A0A1Y1XRJ9_9FUNG|nr:periplasmic binding protein-like II [Anaeromyces robustus]|eukprot:ORX87934.1 periplasmic binding protein-like II [Anaeromyces robustus]
MLLPHLLSLLILIFITNVNSTITINGITNTCYNDDLYTRYAKEFNEYAKQNNLDIEFEINVFTKDNSTVVVTEYETVIESLLEKKSNRYDLFFYDNIFTFKYGSHYLNLENYLPPEHFKIYEEAQIARTCYYNKKWVALPIKTDVTVLYYNDKYLQKYNITIPKTWDELLKSAKYALEQEKKEGNTEFMAYNGLFTRTEMGMCSLYEFIYSFRNSIDAPFPDIQSQEVVDSLEMMNKLKTEVSSAEVFQKLEEYTEEYFDTGNFLFQKFWYCPWLNYNFTILPGNIENVSGSALGGYNLGINKYISEEKKNATAQVLKFLTSIPMQKKLLQEYRFLTSIPEIYEDEEICATFNCDALRRVQLIERPTTKSNDYSDYSEKFRNYIYDFLYGDKSSKYVLEKIDDLTKIHYITLNNKDTSMGLSFFIIALVCLIPILISIIPLFIEKYKGYLTFLPTDFWILIILGTCIMIGSPLLELGKLSPFKCHFNVILITFGCTLNIIPVFFRFVVNFPEINRVSLKISKHRYKFLLPFLFIDVLTNLSLLITPYKIINNSFEEKLYNVCEMENQFGKFILNVMFIYRIFLGLFAVFFLFIEWSIENTHKEIKLISSAITVDAVCFVIFLILKLIDTKHKLFMAYNFIFGLVVIIFALTNYIFLYGMKVIEILISNKIKTMDDSDVKLYMGQFASSRKTIDSSLVISKLSSSNNNSTSTLNKILNYHYKKSISDSNSNPSLSNQGSVYNSFSSGINTSGLQSSTAQQSTGMHSKLNESFSCTGSNDAVYRDRL